MTERTTLQTDLTEALDNFYGCTCKTPDDAKRVEIFMEWARRVANSDTRLIEEVKNALDTFDLTLTRHESVRLLAHGAQKWVDLIDPPEDLDE